MKKTFYILTAVLFIALYSYASNMDYEYAADIRRETGYIVSDRLVATNDGNLWEFDTALPQGKSVVVTFMGQHTTEIEDDVIIKVN